MLGSKSQHKSINYPKNIYISVANMDIDNLTNFFRWWDIVLVFIQNEFNYEKAFFSQNQLLTKLIFSQKKRLTHLEEAL